MAGSVSSRKIREAAVRKAAVHTKGRVAALGRLRTIGQLQPVVAPAFDGAGTSAPGREGEVANGRFGATSTGHTVQAADGRVPTQSNDIRKPTAFVRLNGGGVNNLASSQRLLRMERRRVFPSCRWRSPASFEQVAQEYPSRTDPRTAMRHRRACRPTGQRRLGHGPLR